MSDIEVIDWIDWLEDGAMSFGECRDDFLAEQIDKAHRRGAIDDQLRADLSAHFNLT